MPKRERAPIELTPAPTEGRKGVDARILRTREQLRVAVLEIAESHEINSVSVTTMARMAGINRTTFYQHALSPADLLTDVLTQEISDIRERHMPAILTDPADKREPMWSGMRDLIDYLVKREAVYRRHMHSVAPSMHSILAQQIETATLRLFGEDVLGKLAADSDAWPIAASHYAHGIAAALLKWIDRGPPYDRAFLEEVLDAIRPIWYPSRSGVASPVKRGRARSR